MLWWHKNTKLKLVKKKYIEYLFVTFLCTCTQKLFPGCDDILLLKGSAVTFDIEGAVWRDKAQLETHTRMHTHTKNNRHKDTVLYQYSSIVSHTITNMDILRHTITNAHNTQSDTFPVRSEKCDVLTILHQNNWVSASLRAHTATPELLGFMIVCLSYSHLSALEQSNWAFDTHLLWYIQ